jgi:putative flippase GtrA
MDAVVERSLFYADQAKGGKKQSRKIFIKEMVLYGFIGLASAGIDSGIFFMLRKLGINLYFSNFIGINIGICCSFFLNTFINFRVKDNLLKRAVKFWLVGYCGLLLSMLIMFLGVEALHYRDAFVKLLSIIIVAGLQFLFNKFITFKAARSGVNG